MALLRIFWSKTWLAENKSMRNFFPPIIALFAENLFFETNPLYGIGFDGPDGNFFVVVVFSLIRCRYHSRTLPPTLDSREMFASATAALRMPPSLFPYAGPRIHYTVKYAIKYTAAVKQLPASFAPISTFTVALLQFFIYRAVDCSSIDKHRAPPELTRR